MQHKLHNMLLCNTRITTYGQLRTEENWSTAKPMVLEKMTPVAIAESFLCNTVPYIQLSILVNEKSTTNRISQTFYQLVDLMSNEFHNMSL